MGAGIFVLLGFFVMAIGLLMYCVRTKTFFMFPGQKRAAATWHEVLIAIFGFAVFISFILFG